MLFKVDENLHQEVADLLSQHGHDAATVYDQQMQGQADEDVAAVCRAESRAIVTQDLDFGSWVHKCCYSPSPKKSRKFF